MRKATAQAPTTQDGLPKRSLGRRKIGGVAHDLQFLWCEVAVTTELALAGIGRHGAQCSNHILYFGPQGRELARGRTCRPVIVR